MAFTEAEVRSSTAERELERDGLRCFLRADGGPPALVEVETAARAAEVATTISGQCNGKPIAEFRPEHSSDAEQLVDWVEAHSPSADVLLINLAALPHEPPLAPEFWKGANYNRERLWPGERKTLFILTPSQIRSLARHAADLWDWIPLQFDLREYHADGSESIRHDAQMPMSSETSGDATRRLPGLRERLLQARKAALPDSIIRGDYAWPLFKALVSAGHVREAGNVLHTDLVSNFAEELPESDRAGWFNVLGYHYLSCHNLDRAAQTFASLNEPDDANGLFGLARVAEARRDLDDAERWYRKSLDINERLGNEHDAASTYHQLGNVAEERRDFEDAERWYRKSLEIKERLGNEHGAALTSLNMAILKESQDRNIESGKLAAQAVVGLSKTHDDRWERAARNCFARLIAGANDRERVELAQIWEQAELGPLPTVAAGDVE